jgi:2-polyprenyl-6-methoxyphenol hydroxylase-like FAD-dependent oxidoreductase
VGTSPSQRVVLARELKRHPDAHRRAFEAYEMFLKPFVAKKQKAAAQLSKRFVPSARSYRLVRRGVMRWMFSAMFIKFAFRPFGLKSVLAGYG